MHRFRFRLGTLVMLVLVLGVGFAALRESTENWDSIIFSITLSVLLISVLLGMHRTEARRAFWLGFALLGSAYMGFALVPSIEPRLMTTKALALLDSRIRGEVVVQDVFGWRFENWSTHWDRPQTAREAEEMAAHSRTARRFSFLLSPGGIIFGYLIALFAGTAVVGAFPFSSISFAPLFVVVGAFFVVAVPIVVMVHLFLLIAFCRAVIGLGRRILFGADHNAESLSNGKKSPLEKDVEPQRIANDLWDRWIDGSV